MMRTTLLALCSLVLAPALAFAGEETPATPSSPAAEARTLTYPVLVEEGAAPPELRLDAGGASLTVFFPGEQLDPRPEVHLVSAPARVELRVAEKAAYLLSLGNSAAAGPVGLTLTLEGGRPLTFRLRIAARGEAADSLVEVHLPEEVLQEECSAKLATATDELAACEKRGAIGELDQVAVFFAQMAGAKGSTMIRRVGWHDKQHHLFVEVIDELRFGTHSFLRLSIENRDPKGPKWSPGEPRVQVMDPREPRRLKVNVGTHGLAIGPRESLTLVVVFETPQLAEDTHLRIMIPEAEGQRHLVIENF